MCMLKKYSAQPEVDDTYVKQQEKDAEEARDLEAERQQRIKDGTKSINKNFKQFNDNFYDGFQNSFMDYYQPQIDDQFADANKALDFHLARTGTFNSTNAADSRADLTSAYDNALAGVTSNAANQTSSLRGRVDNEKSTLVSTLNSTGDSERASNEALSRSQNLFATTPEYNPLGEIFAGLTSGWAAANYGNRQQDIYDSYKNAGIGMPSSTSSSRIVN